MCKYNHHDKTEFLQTETLESVVACQAEVC